MATRDWPSGAHWQPQQMSVGVAVPRTRWLAAYSAQQQWLAHLGQRMEIRLTLPATPGLREAAEREAWLMSLASSGDWVRVPAFHRPQPLGNARGAIQVVSAAAAGASAITLSGLLAGQQVLSATVGSFELDGDSNGLADGWLAFSAGSTGSVSYNLSTSAPTHGTKRQQVSATALGTTGSDVAGVFADLAVVGGATYTLAADMQMTAGANVTLSVTIQWRDAGLALLSVATGTAVGSGPLVRVSATDVAPALATSARLILSMSQRVGGAGASTLMLDSVYFGLGSNGAFPGWATLQTGDFIGIGGALQQAASTASEIAGGTLVMPLVLPLRRAVAESAAATWNRPTGVFELMSEPGAAAYTPGIVQGGVEVALREVY